MSVSVIEFWVPGTPISQGSMTHVGNGRMIHKPELIRWRNHVLNVARKAWLEAGWDTLDEPVSIKVTFFFEPPKRPKFNLMAVRPDLDKLCRAIGDALSPDKYTKLLAEDSRIVTWDAAKNYGDKPGALIEITRLGGGSC